MIDHSRIAELTEEIGAEDLAEVANVFLDESDEVVEKLKSGQTSNIAEALHFLKGSALNLGLTTLAQLCHEGEQAATKGTTTPLDLEELTRVYEASKVAFLVMLENKNAA